jgi:hypothetical protein
MFARCFGAEGHRELTLPKGRDGCFGDVRMNWNLVVCFHQICGGEDFATSKLVCKISNVPDGILVGGGPNVQCTVVTTRSAAVFLRTRWRGEAQGLPKRQAVPFRSVSNSDFLLFGGGQVLAAVGATLQLVQAWCGCDGRRTPGFPGNSCGIDYIRRILEQCMIARARSEVFNDEASTSKL